MAEIILKLRHNVTTGERELVVHYESEEDALSHEHERDHRALVESMLGVPVDAVADKIVVERTGGGAAEAREADSVARTRQGLTES